MKPSDSATPKSDAKSPTTPTSTDTKIEDLLERYKTGILHGYTCKKNDCYQVEADDPHFGITEKQAKTALKTLLTSEKNKAVVEELENLLGKADYMLNTQPPVYKVHTKHIRLRIEELREME